MSPLEDAVVECLSRAKTPRTFQQVRRTLKRRFGSLPLAQVQATLELLGQDNMITIIPKKGRTVARYAPTVPVPAEPQPPQPADETATLPKSLETATPSPCAPDAAPVSSGVVQATSRPSSQAPTWPHPHIPSSTRLRLLYLAMLAKTKSRRRTSDASRPAAWFRFVEAINPRPVFVVLAGLIIAFTVFVSLRSTFSRLLSAEDRPDIREKLKEIDEPIQAVRTPQPVAQHATPLKVPALPKAPLDVTSIWSDLDSTQREKLGKLFEEYERKTIEVLNEQQRNKVEQLQRNKGVGVRAIQAGTSRQP